MLALMMSLSARAGCPDPIEASQEARALLLDGRRAEAEEKMKTAQQALSCTLLTPEALAELWLTDATSYALDSDPVAAKASFAAAHRSSPEAWDPALGDQIRALYEEAIAPSDATGFIELAELPRGYHGALNGERAVFPAEVAEGRHLVNIIDRRDNVYFGATTYIPSSEHVEVPYGELPPLKKPTFLIASGVSAAAAGGLAVGALLQDDRIEGATTLSSLNSAYSRQKALGYTSYGLLGIAATSLTLHFVL